MKKWLGMALLCVWVFQDVSAGGFAIFGSYWNAKDYKDATGDALVGGGLKSRFNFSPNVALEGRGSVLFNEVKEGEYKDRFMVLPAEFCLLYSFMPDDPVNVYVGGGAGYYMFQYSEKGPGYSESLSIDSEFGFFGVGGVELALGTGARLFVEAKYTKAEIKKIEGQDAKLVLDGIGANAGLMFVW